MAIEVESPLRTAAKDYSNAAEAHRVALKRVEAARAELEAACDAEDETLQRMRTALAQLQYEAEAQ